MTKSRRWWDRWEKKQTRRKEDHNLIQELVDLWRRRGLSRKPFLNEAGNTTWPDSDLPNERDFHAQNHPKI